MRKILIFLLLLLHIPSVFAVNINIDGNIVEAACTLDPSSNNQEVTFLDRATKYFNFKPGIGPKEIFTIKLIDCDSSLFNTVKLSFLGEQEVNMGSSSNYFLKVTGVNAGKLGIGLIDTDGTPLSLGAASTFGEAHNSGSGTIIGPNKTIFLNFSAFVQATPDAILNKAVIAGEYQASATFGLFYD